MSDLLIEFLLAFLSLASSSSGNPSFVFVRNSGPLPAEDGNGLILMSSELCSSGNGPFFNVKDIKYSYEAWASRKTRRALLGESYIISFVVDLKSVSPLAVIATMKTIRTIWDPKKKTVVIFRLNW